MRRLTGTVVALAAVSAVLQSVAAVPALAAPVPQSTLVSAVPSTNTPDVNNGVVYTIAQVGSTVFIGGSFTSVSPYHTPSTTYAVTNIAAFDATTGALVTTFAPTLDGVVNSIAPGPTSTSVYVGGAFKTVNGVSMRVALLDTTTGAIVSGWKAPKGDGVVNKLLLADGQLYVGGFFQHMGAQPRAGLATLAPLTGLVSSVSTLAFTGHHNYGVHCTSSNCANAPTGVKSMDVSPDGTRMIVTGNFTDVSGSARDQVAMLDVTSSTATVDPNWNTYGFTSPCAPNAFDSYIRDVQFSPDGSYFVIVDTGAGGTGARNIDGTRAICDAAARYETAATGTDVLPTWVDWTGNDTFWTVAITGASVYVGGHQRWVNNSRGSDSAGAGAVPRPGVVALDPQNGLPQAWNPGRNPRGAGAYALLATPNGLYMGSDTDYVGNHAYQRKKIAFFPLAGGEVPLPNSVGSLPGNIYLFGQGGSAVQAVSWDGTTAPTPTTAPVGFDSSVVRGAFAVNGTLYYGSSDGNFYQAPFTGRSIGTPVAIDPYNDPAWSSVLTGSGSGTFRGARPTFYSELSSMTSMFYSNGRIYYTLGTSNQMFWRYFETDDGVIGADEFTTTDGNNWRHVSGAFLANGRLYWADSTSGQLMSIAWSGTQATGTSSVADTSRNWASRGLAILAAGQVTANTAPTASFTISCTTTASPCSADASTSHDADGPITGYSWNWGDGNTSQVTTATTTHTYSTPGTYAVSLTVTDTDNTTGSTSHSVHVTSPTAAPIAFRDSTGFDGVTSAASVVVPATVQAGDEMLLFASSGTTGITMGTPAGWTLLGTTSRSNLMTAIYSRQAAAGDAGTTVTVPFSASVRSTLVLGAYANAADPVEVDASATDVSTANHTSPSVTGLTTGSWAVTFWGDRATTTTAWTPPAGVTKRTDVYGAGGGAVSALLADSGAAVTGTYGGLTATSNVVSGSAASWTVGLNPAG
ncbi:MAG: PKD domain-containing protein [Frankiales bacterium]|nr:PKD domain-containing protein [Frankiales bacterium]